MITLTLVVGCLAIGVVGVVWLEIRARRDRQHRDQDALPVTDREAEGLRSIAAADYAQFARRRKGSR